MDDLEVDALRLGLAAGREQAFAALYDHFGPRMYRAALGMLGRREDAEDVVQEVFMSLVRSRERLAGVDDLAAYLFSALRRASARRVARKGREPSTLDFEALARPDGDSSASPRSDRLERALRALPAEQRTMIALKIEGGLTFAEIARVLDVSPNTAASRYRYALEKLRAALEG